MIIIAPDKFKGTMDAWTASVTIADALRDAGCRESVRLCPMADGGDGSADILRELLPQGCSVVESHAAIGPDRFLTEAAMRRSSHAFGAALAEALRRGGEVLAAIGGTGCCDGGAGMLQALGMRALDADGRLIGEPLTPGLLPQVAAVDFSGLPDCRGLTALSDVTASLLPADGCPLSAMDFALQKGFRPEELPQLEAALRHWQDIASRARSSIDGAGGGVGFALGSVLRARIRSGAEYILDRYGIDFGRVRAVITGEGCIDAQTGGGKVVETVARRATAAGAKVLAVGGRVKGAHPFPTLAVDPPGTASPASGAEAMRRLHKAIEGAFADGLI